jgi:F-type H+-transporting ATPase subunit b
MIGQYIILAAANEGGALAVAQETADRVGLSWQHLLSQTIAFCIVAYMLKRFAFDPIFKVLDERREKIKESLENADKIKAELAAAESNRRDVLQKANDKATALIAEAQKAAGVQGERKLQEAAHQAEDIVKKAREAAVLERERMLADLKREVGRLVIDTTSKVTGKVLTPADQERLNSETSRQLANAN